jgi:hypothetical protein
MIENGPDRFYCGVGLLPGGAPGFLSLVLRRNEQNGPGRRVLLHPES